MNLHDAMTGLAENFGNANITLHAYDDGMWCAAIWADNNTILERTGENAADTLTALLNAIDELVLED